MTLLQIPSAIITVNTGHRYALLNTALFLNTPANARLIAHAS